METLISRQKSTFNLTFKHNKDVITWHTCKGIFKITHAAHIEIVNWQEVQKVPSEASSQ